jgi:hypothetical protein
MINIEINRSNSNLLKIQMKGDFQKHLIICGHSEAIQQNGATVGWN